MSDGLPEPETIKRTQASLQDRTPLLCVCFVTEVHFVLCDVHMPLATTLKASFISSAFAAANNS